MPEDYITLKQALEITGHKDVSQLRRAADRWEAGDHKTGLQAVRLNVRMWVTKRTWVQRWQDKQRPKRGWPKGQKRTPRRPASEEQPQ